MRVFGYNAIKVDYMQLALLAVSYFILNFENIAKRNGKYIYDLEITIKGRPLVLTAEYDLSPQSKGSYPFSFSAESVDVDLELFYDDCYNLACSYASSIAEEFLRVVKK